jgi:hypothetical protein
VNLLLSEDIAGYETGQEVVRSNQATAAHNKERKRDGKNKETLAINITFLFRPMQEMAKQPAHSSDNGNT